MDLLGCCCSRCCWETAEEGGDPHQQWGKQDEEGEGDGDSHHLGQGLFLPTHPCYPKHGEVGREEKKATRERMEKTEKGLQKWWGGLGEGGRGKGENSGRKGGEGKGKRIKGKLPDVWVKGCGCGVFVKMLFFFLFLF